ncbi:hypothetical protein [Clostridium sp.]|nr:hypothetical protein [Clostridium sp.]MBK5236757.1 hypothetical protein [Clostridium sp.]
MTENKIPKDIELALIEGYKDVEAQKRRIEFANIEDVGSEIPKPTA